MSSSFEKSVKGATKIKNAPPKTKYIEHILVATHAGEAGIAEVIRALQYRLRDSTWTVVFKSLITVHLMIREGSPDATLAYLSKNRHSLAISNFSDAQLQGRNIRHYAGYLSERSRAYRDTKTDWVRAPESRLEKMTVDKGLLRETEAVQRQLQALLKCNVLDNEPENEITITVFRLLVLDLLSLFQVQNQGLINILGHFFEMSKPDAERAMDIYRTFTKQTDFVVAFLSVARQHEHHTRVQVPKLKHAPVNLTRQLEEYLGDPDFEINRRQYIAEQEAKRGKPNLGSSSKTFPSTEERPAPAANNPFPKSNGSKPAESAQPKANKGPEPDLIDFFESIEDKQQTMDINPQPTTAPSFQPQPTGAPQFQSNGFVPQQTGFVNNSPYGVQPQPTGFVQQQQQQQPPQIQSNFTGAGFGGFGPQQGGFQPGGLGPIGQNQTMEFNSQGQFGQPQLQQPQQTGLQPGGLQPGGLQPGGLQPGGLHPGGLQPMATGTTNPFRQSMLMTQQTGMAGNPNRQSTNPFARASPTQQSAPFTPGNNSPFQSQPPAALQPAPTGTNPFARNASPQSPVDGHPRPQTAGAALAPQPTGQTNPFRQGAFVNHNTGMGWQHSQQPIGGGLDQLPTQPVFPRPAQQTPWQQ